MTRNQINNVPRQRSGGNAWGKYEFVSLQQQRRSAEGSWAGWQAAQEYSQLLRHQPSHLTLVEWKIIRKWQCGRFLNALCSCQSKSDGCFCCEWMNIDTRHRPWTASYRCKEQNQDFHMQFTLTGERRSKRWTLLPQRMENRIYSKWWIHDTS